MPACSRRQKMWTGVVNEFQEPLPITITTNDVSLCEWDPWSFWITYLCYPAKVPSLAATIFQILTQTLSVPYPPSQPRLAGDNLLPQLRDGDEMLPLMIARSRSCP